MGTGGVVMAINIINNSNKNNYIALRTNDVARLYTLPRIILSTSLNNHTGTYQAWRNRTTPLFEKEQSRAILPGAFKLKQTPLTQRPQLYCSCYLWIITPNAAISVDTVTLVLDDCAPSSDLVVGHADRPHLKDGFRVLPEIGRVPREGRQHIVDSNSVRLFSYFQHFAE